VKPQIHHAFLRVVDVKKLFHVATIITLAVMESSVVPVDLAPILVA